MAVMEGINNKLLNIGGLLATVLLTTLQNAYLYHNKNNFMVFQKVSNDELRDCFDLLYPSAIEDLCRNKEDHESREQSEKFRSISWEKVSEEMILESLDIPLLLSDKAFSYFMPCFIQKTQENYKNLHLTVDCIIQLFASANFDIWAETRCSLFTHKQYTLINKWFYWNSDKYPNTNLLEDAILFTELKLEVTKQ